MSLFISIRILDSVVFPGDTIRCLIKFKNIQSTDSNSNDTSSEHIAWASAQIHSQFVYDPLLIKLSSHSLQKPLPGSNLPKLENGRFIYTSNAEILACGLKLNPQETKSILFTCSIPTDPIPSSYSGTSVKYSHLLSIAVQRSVSPFAGPPLMLTLPFRVLNPLSGLKTLDFKLGCPNFQFTTSCKELDNNEQIPSPFELKTEKPIRNKDTRKILRAVFEKFGKPKSIKINKATEHIAHFTLDQTAFQLGDTVRGYIDFSETKFFCFQLYVLMECCEEIRSDVYANNPTKPYQKFTKMICDHVEVLHNTETTNFRFSIPMESTPTFSTELVTLRWKLKFELVISKFSIKDLTELNGRALNPLDVNVNDIETETLEWQIPIRVLVASHPIDLIEESKQIERVVVV